MLEFQKRLTNFFYVVLSLPATAMGFALSIQIAALSWILSTQYGLEIHDVGLVWAAGPIAGIIGQVIIGIISDNVWFMNGRRRPFILIGGVLAALMLLSLPNIDVISSSLGIDGILGVAIAVALTFDLSINVSFNPTRSIIADVTPEGVERTKGYSWMQTISGTFGVLAYVIGAVWDNYILIYSGVFLVFALSVIPTFFIEEPRELEKSFADEEAETPPKKLSFKEIMINIQPLWGFLIYAVYAITMRLMHKEFDNYWVEIACFAITIFFILHTLIQSDKGKSRSQAGLIGFKKVLAAHSFTWIGIQTMFIYTFAYVQHKIYNIPDTDGIEQSLNDEMGRVVSISFLLLNAVGALLPALVLEPITRKIGRVKTHAISILIAAIGSVGIIFSGNVAEPLIWKISEGVQLPIISSLYLLMMVVGVGWAATISLPFAIMSQKVDKAKMGLYMGLFNLSVVLPQLVASLGIGQVVSKAGDKNIIFIISAVTLFISGILWLVVKESPQYEEKPDN